MNSGPAWGLTLIVASCTTAQPVAPISAPVSSVTAECLAPEPIEDPIPLPFGFYSVPVARFDDLAEAGVTMVGPYYGEPPGRGLLDEAAAHGLGVVYPIGFEQARFEDEARAALEAQLDAVVDHDALVAWYVLPEEVRPWSPSELGYLAWVRHAVRARDPNLRPLLSYQPNHRRSDELATASASLDVVTRGLYANFVGMGRRRAWVREGAATIVAAASSEQTPWAVLEMFEQPERTDAIEAWVRHDVYASLVGGARGVLVFSGFPRQGFPAYATYLRAYLEVARELNGTSGLATALLRGVPTDEVDVRLVAGPRTVDIAAPGASPHLVPSLAWRAFVLGETTWLYLVNSSEDTLELRIGGACAPSTVVGPDVVDGALRLPPLGVSVLLLSHPRDSPLGAARGGVP